MLFDEGMNQMKKLLRVWVMVPALLGLHVAAIVFYRLIKKDDLVKPMLTGYKEIGRAHV